MKSANEMRAHLIARAEADAGFRARLTQDPKSVIEEEFEITIPDGFEIRVHEDTASQGHLILPPSPRLTGEQLDSVSGGNCNYCGCNCVY